MQLHKLEFGQETNFSRGKSSRSVMVTSSQDFQRYVSHAKLPPFSQHLQNAAVGGQAASAVGTGEAWCQARCCEHRVLPSRAGAGQAASCLTHGGLAGSRGPRGELVQLEAGKVGLLLREEGFIAINDLCSSWACQLSTRTGWGRFAIEVSKACSFVTSYLHVPISLFPGSLSA